MLKASIEVLKSSNRQSFLVRTFNKKGFSAPFHFHPEYELTLIVQGKGKRYVGSHMDNYDCGDLVLLGSNLPHCWKLDPEVEENVNARSVVVQFTHQFLGSEFFSSAELVSIKKLLQKSKSGIQFLNKTRQQVQKQMIGLAEEKNNFTALIQLLQILQTLSTTSSYIQLDKHGSIADRSTSDQERINHVFAYIVDNFQKDITLDKAARTINMTPNAFCKYFKKVTRKTFMEAVLEFRINHAVQQLVQTDKTISAICYDSGFGDISHFHKTFKSKMNLSPLHYRRKFVEEVS
jgi:AraC-like DNA-binding protein